MSAQVESARLDLSVDRVVNEGTTPPSNSSLNPKLDNPQASSPSKLSSPAHVSISSSPSNQNSASSSVSTPSSNPPPSTTVPPQSVWAARGQQNRPSAINGANSTLPDLSKRLNGVSITTSTTTSRSSSHQPSSRVPALHLNDASLWPDVGQAVVSSTLTPPRVSNIEASEGSAGTSSKKGGNKTKWVQMSPAELQAALDVNRPPRSQQSRSSTKPSSTKQSSASQSLVNSTRSSPLQTGLSRHLPDVTSSSAISPTVPNLSISNSLHPAMSVAPNNNSLSVPKNLITFHSLPSRPPPALNASVAPFRPTLSVETAQASPVHKPRRTNVRRRPHPSKSKPVSGWTVPRDDLQSHSTQGAPIFGGFKQPLGGNSPGSVVVGLEDISSRPSSPVPVGERDPKQRGKVAIGLTNASQQPATPIGRDDDGWFVVDFASTLFDHTLLPGGVPGSVKYKFGTVGGPSASLAPSPSPTPIPRRVDLPRTANGSSAPSSSQQNTNNSSQRSHNQPQNNSGRRNGRRGGNSSMNSNRNSGIYSRSSSGSNYRPPSLSRLPPPYVPSAYEMDYAPQLGADGFYTGPQHYNYGYAPPTSPGYFPPPPPFGITNPYAPGYLPPHMVPPPPFVPPSVSSPGASSSSIPPPIPMPITQPPFPLDPLRFYLLGQVEYYFSVQNLATDLFMRSHMDPEGWIEMSVIGSFPRVRRLTPDLNLVRDVMSLSSLLEVQDDKTRLAHGRWEDFVLPPGHAAQLRFVSTVPRGEEFAMPGSIPPSPFQPHGDLHSRWTGQSPAYSLAASLSGLSLTGDDAATIQAKVRDAVLATKFDDLSAQRSGAEKKSESEGEGSWVQV